VTSTILAIAVFVAAVTLTYLFCIRPMRRGQCGMGPRRGTNEATRQREEEIRALRREINQLRNDLGQQH
jgi:type VI protein secretion system component VasK